MKIRRSEIIKNSGLNVGSTIKLVKAGIAYAVNTLEQSSEEERMKAMNDLYHIMAAPAGSSIQKEATKELGKDYIEKVSYVYEAMKSVIRIQSEGAC